jgi:2-C-methyl-D-erythritol 4-phosphate cytidylyltransferase/2-C-methyl-D-erythritol 2,4-cyclodiphosphate synthase
LPDLTLIILSAGNSTRFNQKVKKQWMRIEDDPLWLFVAKNFEKVTHFKEIIITASTNELFYMKKHAPYTFIEGGESRQESLKNALSLVTTEYVMVTDVARACVPSIMIEEIIKHKKEADIVVPYLEVSDTVVYQDATIDRDAVKLIQTPQLSKSAILAKALQQKSIYTDDSSAIKAIGGKLFYVKGSQKAKKITRYDDLGALACLKQASNDVFIGSGFDVHQFCDDKKMVLAGVEIPHKQGFLAHSDGDVALHALIDALLGAIGAGDIGELYPDTDMAHKDADSKVMLAEVVTFIRQVGFVINNVDITIMAQTPKISPYKERMRVVIAEILELAPIRVNIKATTTEKLGFVGRKEGVAVEAVASLKYRKWEVK